jgi:uncharacterized protein (TIGR02145 family)
MRGLAPEGWHVPTTYEWRELERYVNGKSMELIDKSQVMDNNLTATNSAGFSALFAGVRDGNDFIGLGYTTRFWSSTKADRDSRVAYYFVLENSNNSINIGSYRNGNGYSVRCLKD